MLLKPTGNHCKPVSKQWFGKVNNFNYWMFTTVLELCEIDNNFYLPRQLGCQNKCLWLRCPFRKPRKSHFVWQKLGCCYKSDLLKNRILIELLRCKRWLRFLGKRFRLSFTETLMSYEGVGHIKDKLFWFFKWSMFWKRNLC
jgi:hypothetical protein